MSTKLKGAESLTALTEWSKSDPNQLHHSRLQEISEALTDSFTNLIHDRWHLLLVLDGAWPPLDRWSWCRSLTVDLASIHHCISSCASVAILTLASIVTIRAIRGSWTDRRCDPAVNGSSVECQWVELAHSFVRGRCCRNVIRR